MTDWWSTAGAEPQGERITPQRKRFEEVPVTQPVPQEEEEAVARTPRSRRGKSLALGAAGVALAGAALFMAMPDGGDAGKAVSGQQAPSQGEYLPPAGDVPTEAAQEPGSASQAPQVVTVEVLSSKPGPIGVVVELAITNGTGEAMVVMSSMVKGDGQSAVIGEGTLAPGSREVVPGGTVTGTVEFAAKKQPAQVVLLDFSGNVVAVS